MHRAKRPLRMPLQTGTSCWSDLARVAALAFPLLGLMALGLVYLTGMERLEHDVGVVLHIGCFMLVILGGVGLVRLLGRLPHAFRAWPSDVVIDSNGLSVDRLLGGKQYAWGTLVPREAEVVEGHVERAAMPFDEGFVGPATDPSMPQAQPPAEPTVSRATLVLTLRDGDHAVLGNAEDPAESESLRALCDTIRAIEEPPPSPHPASSEEPDDDQGATPTIPRCGQCGAQVEPADTQSVTCEHCNSRVELPEDVRELVRAGKQVQRSRASVHALMDKLVQQPRVRKVSIWIATAAIVLFLVWPLSLGVFWASDLHSVYQAIPLLVVPIATIAGLHAVVGIVLARRRALRLVAARFGAVPAREGEPRRCRRCGAPLPSDPLASVVACLFCEADNVVAIDLERHLAPMEEQEQDLEASMAELRKEESGKRYRAVVALGVAMGFAAFISFQIFGGAATLDELPGYAEELASMALLIAVAVFVAWRRRRSGGPGLR